MAENQSIPLDINVFGIKLISFNSIKKAIEFILFFLKDLMLFYTLYEHFQRKFSSPKHAYFKDQS